MLKELYNEYLVQLTQLLQNISVSDILKATDMLLCAYKKQNTIFIFGNGGSGSTASHFASDLNKGVGEKLKNRFRVFCLNDNIPTMLAWANDYSFGDIFIQQLRNFLKPGDLAVGISGSGNSTNVLKAIEYANLNKAYTLGISGFDGGSLAKIADHTIVVPSNDMQKVEDIHLIITHMLMQSLKTILMQKEIDVSSSVNTRRIIEI